MLLAELRARNGHSPYCSQARPASRSPRSRRFWRSVCHQFGLEGVRVHDLRHSFASVIAANGGSLVLIGQLLGHTQPKTTLLYTHLVGSIQREAVERAAAVITGSTGDDSEVLPLRVRR
jgi:integrase